MTSTFKQLTPDIFARYMSIVSLPLPDLRGEARELRTLMTGLLGPAWRHAYLPSILRPYPVVRNGDAFLAPIPTLLIYRATAGLYYDFTADNAKHLLKTAEKRFETYIQDLIRAYLPGAEVLQEIEIGPKKAKFLSPDVLVKSGDTISMIIECKATKNTFAAQFASDLIEGSKRGSDQLCKGVVQIWRFFSAVRRGLYTENPVAAYARGMVVTMDTWLLFDTHVRSSILARAAIEAQRFPEILPEDRKPVAFCSAQDLADTLQESDEAAFYAAVDAYLEPKHAGWDLVGVLREIGRALPAKPFPFDMDEVVPWRRELPDK